MSDNRSCVEPVPCENHFATLYEEAPLGYQSLDAQGRVLVNGEPLDEPYVYRDLPFTAGGLDCASNPASARCFAPIVVPEGKYLVMGDHRSNSADSVAGCRGSTQASECARFVPAERITGKVFAKAWPPGPVG